jgi:hypothetical protein
LSSGYDVFDHVTVRCPALGGEVSFGYCRRLDDGLPCHRALTCFELKFPVDRFFRQVLEAATFRRVFLEQRQGRYERLLQTFAGARKRDR